MNKQFPGQDQTILNVPPSFIDHEMEGVASRFHITAAWVAAIFDPIFAITDYFNIPDDWDSLLAIRIGVALVTLAAIYVRKKLVYSSFIVAFIPFMLISLQNAYTYRFLGNDGMLGQNLNYMALLVGASMFVLWQWKYSMFVVGLSALTTAFFIYTNPNLSVDNFFINGGLLLIVSSIFMILLIRTRFNLTRREISARVALRLSNEEIQSQASEIRRINENLESIVQERTKSLEKKNKALEEYAFINAHKLRSPLASILGLVNLLSKMEMNEEMKKVNEHLKESADKLDETVSEITRTIEKAE